jgi:hypothetical protein
MTAVRCTFTLAAFGSVAFLALQGCGGDDEAVGGGDEPACTKDCVACEVFTLKISDPTAEEINGTRPEKCSVTCTLANVLDEEGVKIWEENARCYGPSTPRCLCDYYKWQVLQQFEAMDADYISAEVDKEAVPQKYAVGCEYLHAKHQCHSEFGAVEDKSKSTDRVVGLNACKCNGECPEEFV